MARRQNASFRERNLPSLHEWILWGLQIDTRSIDHGLGVERDIDFNTSAMFDKSDTSRVTGNDWFSSGVPFRKVEQDPFHRSVF